MKYNPQIHHRRSIRLKGYDYSRAGAYFITIRTQKGKCLFGEIIDGQMVLNGAGRAAEKCWDDIPGHFPHVALDAFVVMPNHVHGILIIIDENVGTQNPDGQNAWAKNIGAKNIGAKNFSPLPEPPGPPKPLNKPPRGTSKTIGSVIRGFKIGVTKWMRQNTEFYQIWQRNYYEHIIRDENDLNRIREYIANNPLKWEMDCENPDFPSNGKKS